MTIGVLTLAMAAEAVAQSSTGNPTSEIAVIVEELRPSPFWKGTCVREEDNKELSSKRIKGVPDSQWCNAFWVHTKEINRSSALLRYVVRCTAYGSKGTVLGTGVSDDTAPDMYTVKLDRVSEVGSFATSYASVRIPNVKLDDVSRVECQALIR